MVVVVVAVVVVVVVVETDLGNCRVGGSAGCVWWKYIVIVVINGIIDV